MMFGRKNNFFNNKLDKSRNFESCGSQDKDAISTQDIIDKVTGFSQNHSVNISKINHYNKFKGRIVSGERPRLKSSVLSHRKDRHEIFSNASKEDSITENLLDFSTFN